MIVVDTNVIAYLWLPGDHTAAAERVLSLDADWNAPLLWRSEFRNVLAGYLRRGLLDLTRAGEIMARAEEQMTGKEFTVPSAQVLARVAASTHSAYDCEFVVLASDLGVRLVTTDRKLIRAFPDVATHLADFSG